MLRRTKHKNIRNLYKKKTFHIYSMKIIMIALSLRLSPLYRFQIIKSGANAWRFVYWLDKAIGERAKSIDLPLWWKMIRRTLNYGHKFNVYVVFSWMRISSMDSLTNDFCFSLDFSVKLFHFLSYTIYFKHVNGYQIASKCFHFYFQFFFLHVWMSVWVVFARAWAVCDHWFVSMIIFDE